MFNTASSSHSNGIYLFFFNFLNWLFFLLLDIDECEPNPCQNGSKCTEDKPGSFVCDCSATGYTGDLCETSNLIL